MSVECLICNRHFETLGTHLKTHNTDSFDYQKKFPGASLSSVEFGQSITNSLLGNKRAEGHVVSQYARDEISQSLSGRTASKETCENISKSLMGQKRTEEQCKRISQGIINSKVPKVFAPILISCEISKDEEEQWITGFWEGDGTCGTYPDILGYMIPHVGFAQKDRRVLEYIQAFFGFGNINQAKEEMYNLTFSSRIRCAKVLELLCKHVESQQSLNKITKVFSADVQRHLPTIPWVVGFYDAEKSLSFGSSHESLVSYISQKDKSLLESAQTLIGGNLHAVESWYHLLLTGDDLRAFIPHVLRYSRHETNTQKLREMLCILALSKGRGVWNEWARAIVNIDNKQ